MDGKKETLKMSLRLHMVADMITSGLVLADIGTDHGYIPIYQVLEGRTPYAYACDVADGPLARAEENIIKYNVSDKIRIVKSDGIMTLCGAEPMPGTIVIAGMGGSLICRILEEGRHILSGAELVLSPHSEIYDVRKYLYDNGYHIIDEDMIKEDGKYYTVIKARQTNDDGAYDGETEDAYNVEAVNTVDNTCVNAYGNVNAIYAGGDTDANAGCKVNAGAGGIPDEVGMIFGPVLIRKRHPVLVQYLTKESDTCTKILENLKMNGSSLSEYRYSEITERKKIIDNLLKKITEV